MNFSHVYMVFRCICYTLIAVFVVAFVAVATLFVNSELLNALCSYEKLSSSIDVDDEFSLSLFTGNKRNILADVERVDVHVAPASRGWISCRTFPENTRIATLTGSDASNFISHSMESKPTMHGESIMHGHGCSSWNDITYHVLVKRRSSERVGYFIVSKHTLSGCDSAMVTYMNGSTMIFDPGIVTHSKDVFSLLSLNAEHPTQQM